MPNPDVTCMVISTMRSVVFYNFYFAHGQFLRIQYTSAHAYTLTHTHNQYGTGWVFLFKHSRSLLISNLGEFCPTSCVSARVRDYTTGCQRLSQRVVVSHSPIISVLDPLHSSVRSLFIYDMQVNESAQISPQLQYTICNI